MPKQKIAETSPDAVLEYVRQQLEAFQPPALRRLGLDVALEMIVNHLEAPRPREVYQMEIVLTPQCDGERRRYSSLHGSRREAERAAADVMAERLVEVLSPEELNVVALEWMPLDLLENLCDERLDLDVAVEITGPVYEQISA